MEAMDEMKDKLDALNQSLSGDLDQVMMDIDKLVSQQEEDISKFCSAVHLRCNAKHK